MRRRRIPFNRRHLGVMFRSGHVATGLEDIDDPDELGDLTDNLMGAAVRRRSSAIADASADLMQNAGTFTSTAVMDGGRAATNDFPAGPPTDEAGLPRPSATGLPAGALGWSVGGAPVMPGEEGDRVDTGWRNTAGEAIYDRPGGAIDSGAWSAPEGFTHVSTERGAEFADARRSEAQADAPFTNVGQGVQTDAAYQERVAQELRRQAGVARQQEAARRGEAVSRDPMTDEVTVIDPNSGTMTTVNYSTGETRQEAAPEAYLQQRLERQQQNAAGSGGGLGGALGGLLGLGGAAGMGSIAGQLGAVGPAFQQLAYGNEAIGRQVVAALLGSTQPELDRIRGYLEEQRNQVNATAEHRALVDQDTWRRQVMQSIDELRAFQGPRRY